MQNNRTKRNEPTILRQIAFYIWSFAMVALCCYVIEGHAARITPTLAAPTPTPIAAEPIRYVAVSSVEDKASSSVAGSAVVRIKATSSPQDLTGDEPTILIYHTHTLEAYTQTEDNQYVETSSWRTADDDRNVVAVGEALAETLRKEYGYCVIHDRTNHEPPSLKTAYDRSEQTMQAYLKKYPELTLFIDLHRDSYTVTGVPTTDYAEPYGDNTCRVMCVVGQGINSEVKPYYEANLALAESLTKYLTNMDSRLARPVRVKSGRYNQHVSPYCLLIEVGHNANTLEQALSVVPYLADAIVLAMADMQNQTVEQADNAENLLCWVPEGGED